MADEAAGRSVRTRVRVRYPETDRMGFAHHARYLEWLEIGRTEYLRAIGCSYRELEDGGVMFPVAEIDCRYLSPAFYDDVIEIDTAVEVVRGARLSFRYRIERPADGTLLCEARSMHAAMNADGRVVRMPPELRDKLVADPQPVDAVEVDA